MVGEGIERCPSRHPGHEATGGPSHPKANETGGPTVGLAIENVNDTADHLSTKCIPSYVGRWSASPPRDQQSGLITPDRNTGVLALKSMFWGLPLRTGK